MLCIPGIAILGWRQYYANTFADVSLGGDIAHSSIEEEPVQIDVDRLVQSGSYKNLSLTIDYKAYYEITGAVASVHDYYGFGFYETLVPRDVCLVWGGSEDKLKILIQA